MTTRKKKSPLAKLLSSNDEKYKYETTRKACQYWYNVLNKELFDGRLQPVDWDIRWRRGKYAYFEFYPNRKTSPKIHMNKKYKTKKFFVEVLAHEMVHHYQYDCGDNDCSHGNTFLSWTEKFNKKGLSLQRAYNT